MNIWIVYESRLGNTAQLATRLAQVLARSENVRLLPAGQAGVPQQVELLLIGIPSHRHRRPDSVLDWLRHMPKNALVGMRVSVFDVRFQPLRWFETSMIDRIGRKLLHLGAVYAAPPCSFYLVGHEGPLAIGEEQRASGWVGEMLNGKIK